MSSALKPVQLIPERTLALSPSFMTANNSLKGGISAMFDCPSPSGSDLTGKEHDDHDADDIYRRQIDCSGADGSYDAHGRRRHVQKVVDEIKKKWTCDASKALMRPTASSKRKFSARQVPLREARRLHAADAPKIKLGPRHVQVGDAVRWMSRLSSDPKEEQMRAQRRAEELAKDQELREGIDNREASRRLLSLSAGLKSELSIFLSFLLDWASSASVMGARKSEMSRELAILEQQNAHQQQQFEKLSKALGPKRLHLIGSSFEQHEEPAAVDENAGDSKQQQQQQDFDDTAPPAGHGNNNNMASRTSKRSSSLNMNSILRNAAKGAGNKELTVEAFAQLKSYFNILDVDGGGTLSLDEILEAVRICGRRDTTNVVAAMKALDDDGSGAISMSEAAAGVFFPHLTLAQVLRFERQNKDAIEAQLNPQNRISKDDRKDIAAIFKIFDAMPGGATAKNLLSRASEWTRNRPDMIENAVALFDKNSDGRLDEEEFFELVKFSYPPFVADRHSEIEKERALEAAANKSLAAQAAEAETRSSKADLLIMSQTGVTSTTTPSAASSSIKTPRPPASGGSLSALNQLRRPLLRLDDRGRKSRNVIEAAERQRKNEAEEAKANEDAANREQQLESKKQLEEGGRDAAFSISNLAEARWSVIAQQVNKPVVGHTTTLLGVRDLPSVDSGSVSARWNHLQRRRQSSSRSELSSAAPGENRFMEKKLRKILGSNFDARGNFSPTRASVATESLASLERLRSKMVTPSLP